MRKPFAMLRMLALLAIGLSAFCVIQDARYGTRFGWTSEATSRRFVRRVQSAADEYRMLEELREIPSVSRFGADTLVTLLADSNSEVRRLALQVIHEHLDVWRLSIEGSGGTRIVNLLRSLENVASVNPARYRFAGRNLIERVQLLHQHSDSASRKQCLELCQQLARSLATPELRTANRNDSTDVEATEASEDPFEFPGGGL